MTGQPPPPDPHQDQPPVPEPGTGQDRVTHADAAAVETELPTDLTSAGQARAAVRQALAAWRMDHLSGDAELLASELVANAAEHGDGTPIGLTLRRHVEPGGRTGVTCEVTDTAAQSPQSPQLPEPAGPDAERGRGLTIVAALAHSSGVRASQVGKTSWFTLALADRAHRIARQIDYEPEAGG